MKKIEKHSFITPEMEVRSADGKMILSGYAAVFDSPSNPLPFIETIARGAFTKTLSENPDVRLLINHDGLPLARTTNGSLVLREDEKGLYFEATLPDTQEARDLYTLVGEGLVTQMSFSFRVVRQEWNQDRSQRKLLEISLRNGDVAPVTFPAYDAPSVEARNMKDKVTEVLAKLETFKEQRAAENAPAKQLAFDAAISALADLITLEAAELKDGEDEYCSLDYLLDAVEALFNWRVNENWESPVNDVPDNAMPMESDSAPRSISLRLAQAISNK